METTQVVVVDLDRICEEMAKAIPQLDCPDCCGPVYEFIESGAVVYWEEWHWAVLCECVRKRRGSAPGCSPSQD